MNRTTWDLWVGIFVAVGIAAMIGLAMKVGNLTSTHLGPTYRVYAYYNNIGGLKVRAPVKSSGVVVGRVADISFDNKKFEALVALDIDTRYQFPKDTIAAIFTSGLLGEQYVGLEAGGEEEMLKNGDKIEQTQGAVVLEKLISQFLYSKASESSTAPSAKSENKTVE
ncbi:MAG: outer membrane lipid asymmetry maintenance protein MlaD [Methylophilaceae bacterium]|nr:outer membrane lipid asymmetry maintenance protein MlaD [Methylophilaceae bacterium]